MHPHAPTVEVEPLFRLAESLHRGGNYSAAKTIYENILSVAPEHAESLHMLGTILIDQGDFERAERVIRKSIEVRPYLMDAHNNLAVVLFIRKEYEGSAVAARRCIQLSPEFATAHSNLGLSLLHLDRYEEAEGALREAVRLSRESSDALVNLGNVLKFQCNWAGAEDCYRRAIAMQPGKTGAHQNLGILLLLTGRYEEGWQEMEWRNRHAGQSQPHEWNGEFKPGETILLKSEQGFGDTIHFLRYVPLFLARAKGARVILECQPELLRLVQSMPLGIEVIARGEPVVANHSIQLPSLPLATGQIQPLRMAAPYLSAPVRNTLGKRSGKLRVGLAWSGSSETWNDRRRSIGIDRLAPLLSVPNVEFYSLQVRATEIPANVTDLTPHITDFADTASLMTELDLIISVDTAPAHLAGAVGRPVWVMLPKVPDWRWGVDSEETPWYPTMRLFRQKTAGDWAEVIDRVADELHRFTKG